jgi:fructosamine-3-kinase
MTDANVRHAVAATLRRELGALDEWRALNASGFSSTWRAHAGAARWFVKSVPAHLADLVEAEADGLAALAATGAVRVPAFAGPWRSDDRSTVVLALEWLDLVPSNAGFGTRLGHAMAALHRAHCPLQPPRYGWRRDNRIGATPQTNTPTHDDTTADWIGFVAHQRLGAMRERLPARASRAMLRDVVDRAIDVLPNLFGDGHHPCPSLIHGDLWRGNWGQLADGTPVIYDPAVSCSDAEAELAMMELFGAPPAGFWDAYRDTADLHCGYTRRRSAYQLYHLLNHVVLFGDAYLSAALQAARRVAATHGVSRP